MAQLTIDRGVSAADKIEEAACLFSQDGSIGNKQMLDFARFCRREGYLDEVPVDAAIAAGDAKYIKDVIFKGTSKDGIRKWICTGELGGRWVARRRADEQQRMCFLRLLRKKRDDADRSLQFELKLFNADFQKELTVDDLLS